MIEVKTDTSKLEAAIRDFAKLTRKDLGEVMRTQAGILVGHVIAITPPGGSNGQSMAAQGGISIDAKKRGENRLAADIARLFPTSTLPTDQMEAMARNGFEWKVGKEHKVTIRSVARSPGDLVILHKQARNPNTGRTRKMMGHGMAVTRKALLAAYTRQAIRKVGLLNAGWIAAARALKTASRAVPAWITRHGAQGGGANVLDSGSKVAIRISNANGWFPKGMDARVDFALKRREEGLKKATEAILERRAKAAEARMK